ncbi:MAG: class III extradiol ring-cleavage dioxygenase [Gammaproteobacteria bacterium]
MSGGDARGRGERREAGGALPGLFVSHGAPDLLLSHLPARRFFVEVGKRLARPRGIVAVSAHWLTPSLQATAPAPLETIHDFHGWPAPLYEMEYQATGAAWLNEALAEALEGAGFSLAGASRQGLDHGAWVPLSLMYPGADIPVAQLSLLNGASPEEHFRIGEALARLRRAGILVLGSGGVVHNLRAMAPEGTPPEAWARSFDEWIWDRLRSRELHALFRFAEKAEYAAEAHPTDEHLMPLFLAMGTGWSEGGVRRIHHGFSYGNISMAAYAFGSPGALSPLS